MLKAPFLVSGNAATRYSGSRAIETSLSGGQYILYDATRGGGIRTYNSQRLNDYVGAVNFKDTDNNWTAAEYNNANKDNGALDAHWGTAKVYDYWKNVHNRNSYNNFGAPLTSYVHYNIQAIDPTKHNNNAFWDGSVMTYGDGTGAGGHDIFTSLDICAHEIGHAVTSYTSNLVYSYESGALNEGFSDIWAACVENYVDPTKQKWLIGEEIEMRPGHTAIRSMSNPKSENYPDTYNGINWYSGSQDYGGVHINSGVLNHWFYILSVGKYGVNDNGTSYNVSGIGIDKAARIAYRTASVYLNSVSKFYEMQDYSVQAANDLYGYGSAEVNSVLGAWCAVGLGTCCQNNFTVIDIIAKDRTYQVSNKITASSEINDNLNVSMSGAVVELKPGFACKSNSSISNFRAFYGPCSSTASKNITDVVAQNDNNNDGSGELSIDKVYKVFPNPNNGFFNVQFADGKKNLVEIFSITGQKVFEKNYENITDTVIDFNRKGAGVYVVKITSGDKIVNLKMVVN